MGMIKAMKCVTQVACQFPERNAQWESLDTQKGIKYSVTNTCVPAHLGDYRRG